MKIIDINRRNENLIIEVSQKEYSKIIIAIEKAYPPIVVAHTRFSKDDCWDKLGLGELIIADDKIEENEKSNT